MGKKSTLLGEHTPGKRIENYSAQIYVKHFGRSFIRWIARNNDDYYSMNQIFDWDLHELVI